MAAFNFAKAASKAVSNSFVREGREHISIDDLAAEYPNGVTITEFDMLNSKDGAFPTFAYAEDINKFFNGNTSLKNIVDAWLAEFNGDVEECSNALVGVGATMAPSSQVWKGICAAFVRPANARQHTGNIASPGMAWPIVRNSSSESVPKQTAQA